MPHLARQVTLQQQPDQPQVAWSNPLCDKLVYAGTPVGIQFIDAAQNQKSAIASGTPTVKSFQKGRAVNVGGAAWYTVARRGNGSTNGYILTTDTPQTLFCLCYSTSAAGGQIPFQLGEVTDSNFRNGIKIDTAAGVLTWQNDNVNVDSTLSTAANTLLSLAIVQRATNSRIFMLNGVIQTNATAVSSSACAGGMAIGSGFVNSASDLPFTGNIFIAAAWRRALQQSELRSLYANPWQLFSWSKRKQFVQPAAVAAGIAFDAAANSGDIAAANTYSGSASWNGANRLLAVDVSCLGAGVTVTSMTYGGAACTFIGSRATVTSLGSVECWRIKSTDSGAPAVGSNTLVVNLSGSIEFTVEWASYTGVNQVTPTEAFNSAQATNVGAADATVTITTVSDNCWVHGAVVASDTTITANQTSRNNVSGTLGSGANEDNNAAKTPAGAVTMSYTNVAALATWAIAGYGIIPVADFEAANRRSIGPKVGARSYN